MGSVLGYALDHQLWDQAGPIARALNAYWEARGLHGEAAGWIDRSWLLLSSRMAPRPH